MKRFALAAALALTGCATTAVPPGPVAPAFDASAIVAAIRAAGEGVASETEVQPLADPLVVDLREQARRAEQAGRLVDAKASLDRALAERPQDPGTLQERAELALLDHDADAAFDFARRAHAAGPTVGPLCRRSLETLVQVERIHGAAGDATASARADAFARERDACTLKPPPRY